ncbi:hypothetical protein CDAR_26171 [Caerostris darwini]|uniref:Uncharacterized protein n=1 Tax=Caerostris darwini TaxID=1538125 RepID=A0AAV4NAT5_9ARAC|nr:hypothetical protein CDAR_26171 [Caerostris darwini]
MQLKRKRREHIVGGLLSAADRSAVEGYGYARDPPPLIHYLIPMALHSRCPGAGTSWEKNLSSDSATWATPLA